MLNRLLILFLLMTGWIGLKAQDLDTLRVMTYNLLNYRNYTTYCTAQNNDPVAKETNLKIIHWYYHPDILICNEIGASPTSNYSFLVDNVLNTAGYTSYKAANFSNNSFSPLVNMLYYNSNKVGLYKQEAVSKDLNGSNLVRVIDIYTLYYKDPNLPIHQDTIFITAISAHLKAGSATADETDRAKATAALIDYLKNHEIRGNVFMGGDFNITSSQAASYQNLVNESDAIYRFHDPINKPGNWSNNSTFAAIHSQSTHSTGGCPSGGGLDDRFDFLLVQFPMTASANDVSYITGSYHSLGNPGNAYNQALPTSNNSAVPNQVAQALYNVSDHLPVVMGLEVKQKPVGMEKPAIPGLVYPTVVSDHLPLQWNVSAQSLTFTLFNLQGQPVRWQKAEGLSGYTSLDLHHLPDGIYLLTVEDAAGNRANGRIVKF